MTQSRIRLTQHAHGGGCACKIPPGELESLVGELLGGAEFSNSNGNSNGSLDATSNGNSSGGALGGGLNELLVGLDHGDDGAVVRISETTAVISTADFFTPVVDDPYDFGRIAAANALSDVYAMGGRPIAAINLVGWPRETLSLETLRDVLRGGLAIASEAGCPVAGGHSIDDPEPKYGMAVTGVADPAHLLRNDAALAGEALSLSKPLGVGVLNNRHKATGEVFENAIASMVRLNRIAAEQAVAAGLRAATDVTGFGLLGHLYKMARASGLTAIVDAAAVPYLDGAREALAAGYVSGGTRRNLEWVRPHLSSAVDEDEALLLADAQTSGGLLVAGEIAEATVIGEFVPRREAIIEIR